MDDCVASLAVTCSLPPTTEPIADRLPLEPRSSRLNAEIDRILPSSSTRKSSFLRPATVRPCLSRTTTGNNTRLTLTSIGGALYCGSVFENEVTGEGEIDPGWLGVTVAGTDAARGGFATCRRWDMEPASSPAAICSAFSAFAAGTVARAPEGAVTDGVAACCGRDWVDAVPRGDFSPAAGEAWTLGVLSVLDGAGTTAAADCSVMIRDVEANMW